VSGEAIAVITSAGAAVLGSIMSVLLLSFRVGNLVGQVTGFMRASEADRRTLHAENASTESKLDAHIAQHASWRPR